MAEDVVDVAIESHSLPEGKSITTQLHIHGYQENTEFDASLYYYGTDRQYIEQLITDDPSLGEKIHHAFPYVTAEILWAVREEMCMTIEDFLARRSRMLFLDAGASIEAAPFVAEVMAAILEHDQSWVRQQTDDYKLIAKNYLPTIN